MRIEACKFKCDGNRKNRSRNLNSVPHGPSNYDLLVVCVTCEKRPLVYHEKQRPLVSPRKMFMWPYDKSAIIIEICFFIFTIVIRADVSENRN